MASKDEDFKDQANAYDDGNTTFFQHLEGRGARALHMDPTGPEALQIQADYLKVLGDGQHPVDVLRRISLNPWVSPKDRIAASKTLLEYCMAKMPTKIEQTTTEQKKIELDTKALKNLTPVELDTMIKLLDKANNIE